MIEQQINSEYKFAKQHTTETIQKMMPQLEPYVDTYRESVEGYFMDNNYTYTKKDGTVCHWDSKQERYQYMQTMKLDRLHQLCWDVVVACIIKPRATFTEVVGKIYNRFNLSTERMKIETAADIVALMQDTPFVNIEYPRNSEEGVLMIQSKVNLTPEVKEYLSEQRFILPTLCEPKKVTTNSDCGYFTIRESVILSGKHHDKYVNLHHLNRANSVALRIDDRIPRLVEPVFKEKLRESADDRLKRYEAWKQLNVQCMGIYAKLTDRDIYLTHRYCERGRTYARGHHANSQGDDFRKASLELAHRELINT